MTAGGAQSARSVVDPRRSFTTEIVFEYTGHAPARIQGPASGQVYRFDGPGARVRVDARDRPGLAALPTLRWVK
jgi:hypothetical protein